MRIDDYRGKVLEEIRKAIRNYDPFHCKPEETYEMFASRIALENLLRAVEKIETEGDNKESEDWLWEET